MTLKQSNNSIRRGVAALVAFALLLPLLALPAVPAIAQVPKKPGMSMGKKLLVIGGAALAFYLYKRYTAKRQEQMAMQGGAMSGNGSMGNNRGGMMNAAQKMPQLYRSETSGRIYYRDPKNPKVAIYLSVPNKPIQVPADEVQRYAPNYKQYQGQPAPTAPRGSMVRPFSEFDRSAFQGSGMVPGPRQ